MRAPTRPARLTPTALLVLSLALSLGLSLGLLAACGGEGPPPHIERPAAPESDGIHGFAHGCYAVDATEPGSTNTRWLQASRRRDPEAESGEVALFAFTATSEEEGARFRMQPSDLGTYLLLDAEGSYLTAVDGELRRESELLSDLLLLDDDYRSPAEWEVEAHPDDPERFRLRHYATGQYLSRDLRGNGGLSESEGEAAVVAFYPQQSSECATFPELTVDAEGEVTRTEWEDGDVFGFVEMHAHMFTNFGFGGGGIFHGSPFHRLGVEQALPSCEPFHGPTGRSDIIGYTFQSSGVDISPSDILPTLITGMTPDFNHHPEGYPEFTDWPSSWGTPTHQTMYYRWVERAWRGGMRLLVQHATTNSVLCELVVGNRYQAVRYSCNDMVGVDREIEETYNLERYIDAQSGGPGLGWFRVVTSPEQARAVIREGKLAVILGIETSNLFDCFLTPREGYPACTPEVVRAKLDQYYERGVRVIFPVHKYDNAFSPGDGHRGVIELGNFVNSGHFSNYVTECPADVQRTFDDGGVGFGGINMPREVYDSPAPADTSGFLDSPFGTVSPYLDLLFEPSIEGEFCQNASLTPLGETLIREMMQRGMLIETDHLPQWSYARAFEILEEAGYPPVSTHGNNNFGRIFPLGGHGSIGLGRCADPDRPGSMGDGLRRRIQDITDAGGYPSEGFGFDLNGFAGGPRPRFGEDSRCGAPQSNPITYPFTSYAGDVTFTEPHLGNRTVDFNNEGMIHVGLLPEYIEDARRNGVTDEDLEPLFRSAEGYLRMWEQAEAIGAAMRSGG